MADLRGQQLKDSYQDVVTDSGSDLSGIENGNGVDITSRIVERGSNSDGEFVRFADGTQLCQLNRIDLSRSSDSVLRQTWNYPQPYSEQPAISILIIGSGISFDGISWDDLLFPYILTPSSTDADISIRVTSGSITSGNNTVVGATVKSSGRWK